jgi:hypothetical protein
MSAATNAEMDARFRRLERIAAQTFLQVNGDRGFGPGAVQRYPCPDCDDGRKPDGFACERCAATGTISLKAQATIDAWQIFKESEEPVLETRA